MFDRVSYVKIEKSINVHHLSFYENHTRVTKHRYQERLLFRRYL